MNGVTLTASVVLYHSPIAMVERHLQSLLKAFEVFSAEYKGSSLQFYCIDNSMDDTYYAKVVELVNGCVDAVGASHDDSGVTAECIKSLRNKGYGDAHNQVLERISSDHSTNAQNANDQGPKDLNTNTQAYHIVLNPDVYLAEDCLLACYRQIAGDASIAMVSAKIIDNYEAVPHVAKRFPGVRVLLGRYLSENLWPKLQAYYLYQDKDSTEAFDVEMAGGCFYFARLNALLELKGFNNDYFLYFEDFDLCLRLQKNSWRIRYEPKATIQHDGGGVKTKPLRHQWYFACSALRFYRDHGWQF